MLVDQVVPLPGAITSGQKKHATLVQTDYLKGKEKEKPRQMVSVLNPDKLAVNFQVFKRILRQ